MATFVVVAVTSRFVHVYGKGFTSTPYNSRSGAAALAKRIRTELESEGRAHEVTLKVKRII